MVPAIQIGGGGGFDNIWIEMRNGRYVAVKRLRNIPHPTHVRREIRNLQRLSHPNIVQYIDYESNPGNIDIVMEYYALGDLKTLIDDGQQVYTISLVIDWACQLFEALVYLEKMKMYHRDIKPTNILLGENHEIKLSDFYLSKTEETEASGYGVIGTIRYMAPERYRYDDDGHYAYASDLYSAGLVLWECIERRTVYNGVNNAWDLMSRICNGIPLERVGCKASVADLIEKCIHRLPEDRPIAAEALIEATGLKNESFYEQLCFGPIRVTPDWADRQPSRVVQSLETWHHFREAAEEAFHVELSDAEPDYELSDAEPDYELSDWTSPSDSEELSLEATSQENLQELQQAMAQKQRIASDELKEMMTNIREGKELTIGQQEAWVKKAIGQKWIASEFTSENGFGLKMEIDSAGWKAEHQLLKGKTDLQPFYYSFIEGLGKQRSHEGFLSFQFDQSTRNDVAQMMNTLISAPWQGALSISRCRLYFGKASDLPPEKDMSTWTGAWKQIDFDATQIGELGSGAFGVVDLEFRNGRLVAVKHLPSHLHKNSLRREIKTLQSLKHRNIVEYIEYYLSDKGRRTNLVTEYCDRGDLKTFIFRKEQQYPISLVIDWSNQLFDVLLYLQGKKFYHRDIKPSNILLGQKHEIKLCDFGLSKTEDAESLKYGLMGTVRYIPPERFHDDSIYTYACDLYSAGLALWECIERRLTFHEAKNTVMLISRISCWDPLARANCEKPVADLIEKCVSPHPENRPAVTKALQEANDLKKEPFYEHNYVVPEISTIVLEKTAEAQESSDAQCAVVPYHWTTSGEIPRSGGS